MTNVAWNPREDLIAKPPHSEISVRRNQVGLELRAMQGIAVALLAEDREQFNTLQNCLQATRLGREVFSHLGFPVSPTDTIIRQLQESRAEVVIVDVPSQSAQRAIRSIELIRATTQQIVIFASGDLIHPGNIVACMAQWRERICGSVCWTRGSSGGSDALYLLAQAGAESSQKSAGVHIPQLQRRRRMHDRRGQHRARFAKEPRRRNSGRSGADRPCRSPFELETAIRRLDALRNLHRMDVSLLDGFVTTTKEGLHLLAGPQQLYPYKPQPSELARLFDLLVKHYRFVIVDASSR